MYTVSVIIPTYKRANSLLRCLVSVTQQNYRPSEILIIDGDENSGLEDFLEINFRIDIPYQVIKSLPGLTRQRNVGIRRAEGDIVLFLDDDVVLDKDHVKEIVRVFEQYPDNTGGVSGKVEGARGPGNKLVKILSVIYARIFFLYHEKDGKFLPSGFATHCSYDHYKDITPVEFLFGCNMAFKRETILQFDFDERLYRYMHLEDDDIAYRVSRKYQNYWTPFAKLYHEGPEGKRNDYLRSQALFRNHKYLHRKNFPQTFSNKAFFLLSRIGWLNLEFFRGIVKLDLSRFLGMVSNFNFFKKRGEEMNKTKKIGCVYLIISIVGIFAYAALLLRFTFATLMVSVFLLVALVLGLLGWVGFIMLTTPDVKVKSE